MQRPPGPDGYFDESVAATYDESVAAQGLYDPDVLEPAVELLAELAGGGRALELGIGTGRVALALAERGVPVHGIELSQAMATRLRDKPGGDRIRVTIGDFATTRVDETFTLAYLVRNTIMNLTTQEAQVACFRNVAAHLDRGGCFVVEVLVPGLQRLAPGQRIQDFHLSDERWGLDEIDVVNQALVSHHFTFTDEGITRWSAPFRYVWPSELDLMAQLAGMQLRDRWGGWRGEPYTAETREHVSVWELSQ